MLQPYGNDEFRWQANTVSRHESQSITSKQLKHYALPMEIWREVVARRQRYIDALSKMEAVGICEINDLVTYNLDIRQFAQDMIQQCERPVGRAVRRTARWTQDMLQ